MVDINEYFESLPESEEVLRQQATERVRKTFYKMQLHSLYGNANWMVVSARTKEYLEENGFSS